MTIRRMIQLIPRKYLSFVDAVQALSKYKILDVEVH